jgi:D-beta-D-heptose 7-phosphate kinase/D-beta-D-heptose 1-phosphate adenosyltransferase
MNIPDFSSRRVACIGDLMLDMFVRGKVERLSPEAPTVIMSPGAHTPLLGGVANVACNVVSLGGHASLVSVVGEDNAASQARSLLQANERLRFHVQPDPSRQTTQKIRFVSSVQHLLRVDHEDTHALPERVEEEVWKACREMIRDADLVLLSDYGKGVLTNTLLARVIGAAKQSGKMVLIDPKGRDYHRYRGSHILTPNAHELKEATGLPTQTDQEVEKAAQALIHTVNCQGVVVTRGKLGLSVVSASEGAFHVPTRAQEVFDVSGAGDTLVAALGLALAAGMPLDEAVQVANHAAGIAVSKLGTATVSYDELTAHLSNQLITSKLTSLEEMVERRDRWRRQGKRVAFTNGCFDLLHGGHLRTFFEARSRCDHLIVGLNTDSSVALLKGPQRPLQRQDVRAAVLASLPTVDGVVFFSEPTPLALIEALQPDLLVKGGDYQVDNVVGAASLQRWGGEILLVSLVPDQSTSSLIERFLSPPPLPCNRRPEPSLSRRPS